MLSHIQMLINDYFTVNTEENWSFRIQILYKVLKILLARKLKNDDLLRNLRIETDCLTDGTMTGKLKYFSNMKLYSGLKRNKSDGGRDSWKKGQETTKTNINTGLWSSPGHEWLLVESFWAGRNESDIRQWTCYMKRVKKKVFFYRKYS